MTKVSQPASDVSRVSASHVLRRLTVGTGRRHGRSHLRWLPSPGARAAWRPTDRPTLDDAGGDEVATALRGADDGSVRQVPARRFVERADAAARALE